LSEQGWGSSRGERSWESRRQVRGQFHVKRICQRCEGLDTTLGRGREKMERELSLAEEEKRPEKGKNLKGGENPRSLVREKAILLRTLRKKSGMGPAHQRWPDSWKERSRKHEGDRAGTDIKGGFMQAILLLIT